MAQFTEVHFAVKNGVCNARVYSPDLKNKYNDYCVIMGHGFGLTLDCGLEPYIARYTGNGFYVLVFDYRHFGISDGHPRQLLSPWKQIQDWRAAIKYARQGIGNTPKKIILWGTSFSGGYVILAGAKDKDIAAIVAQCPAMDGISMMVNAFRYSGFINLCKLVYHGFLDFLCGILHLKPHPMKIYGKPGETAMMSSHDSARGYQTITALSRTFKNEICPRFMLLLWMHRPVSKARQIQCPALLLICDQDSVAPAYSAELVREKCDRYVTAIHYDIGHFDIYTGNDREKSLHDQMKFLEKVLF